MEDRLTKKAIALSEEGPKYKKILVVDTIKIPMFYNKSGIKKVVDDIRKRNRSAMVEDLECTGQEYRENIVDRELGRALGECQEQVFPDSIMAFNLAKLSDEERSRLFCRRLGYCNSNLLPECVVMRIMVSCRS